MRIHILEPLLANQIAAGEVIERPSSIVKELIENSLDAKATELDITIEQGGFKLVKVNDNGCGIHQDDLALALSRHGTSKIKTLSDLEQIHTLGFRGEALASIAAVSRLCLISAQPNAKSAWQIEVAGHNSEAKIIPAAHPTGTSVIVHDLFFNTPARRKFLRAEKTEFSHIETICRHLALSRFDIKITLTHNGKQILALAPAITEAQQEQRISKICGKNFLAHCVKLESNAHGMRLWGWIAAPSYTKANTSAQYFYLNGRIIRDKIILHAIKQAYANYIVPQQHPAFILFLTLDPSQVDVNVHPTKHEVRLHEPRMVHDFILQNLRPLFTPTTETLHQQEVALVANSEPNFSNVPYAPSTASTSLPVRENSQHKNISASYKTLYGKEHYLAKEKTDNPLANLAVLQNPIGLLKQRYLLCESETGLTLIDLFAWVKQTTLTQLTQAAVHKPIASKPLLFPTTLHLSADAIKTLAVNFALLADLGFDISSLGETSLIVRHVPAELNKFAVSEFVHRLLPLCKVGENLEAKLLDLVADVQTKSLALQTADQAIRLLSQLIKSQDETEKLVVRFSKTLSFSAIEKL